MAPHQPTKYRNRPIWECVACRTPQDFAPGEKKECDHCHSDGFRRFDSQAEWRRWRVLRDMEQHGEISDLTCQGRWPLIVSGIHVAYYQSDFDYTRDGQRVVEDVKGGQATRTAAYKLKNRLFWACWGIHIQEVSG